MIFKRRKGSSTESSQRLEEICKIVLKLNGLKFSHRGRGPEGNQILFKTAYPWFAEKNEINKTIKKFLIQIEDTQIGISMSTEKMFTCLSPSSDWIAAVWGFAQPTVKMRRQWLTFCEEEEASKEWAVSGLVPWSTFGKSFPKAQPRGPERGFLIARGVGRLIVLVFK